MIALLTSMQTYATHIVGGEIFYELKNASTNLYLIEMHVFVDCQNGSAGAIAQDEIATIGVFNAGTNKLITTYDVSRVGPYRINEANYKCVKPPTGVCVDEYIYKTLQIIDPGDNGVVLAFQRCCRNNTINNIVAPESTGATFWVKIPPKSTPNTSAVFKTLPPNYVCVNAPLTFDHSATDVDGDSLAYYLCEPFNGASTNSPKPSIPDPPDYQNIMWSIGYNTFNQISGSPKLAINSKTGELTVTPDKLGQFVIGIVVQEFRKGKLVGETYRDYQMNVINCQFDILADFTTENGGNTGEAYVFECMDTVFFKNRSLKADTYEWNFGDPSTTDDTSTIKDPWWVYPGNGDYIVTLKVTNEICEDEYKFMVRIRSTRSFSLGPDLIFCKNFSQLLDTKTPEATSVQWNTGLFGQRIRVNKPGTYIATVSFGQCVYIDTVELFSYPVNLDLPDDSLICDEIDFDLDAGISGLRYQWSTGANDTLQSLRITAVGYYSLIASNEHCTEYDTIRIWLASKPEVNDSFYCGDFTHLADAGAFEEASYQWSNGSTNRIASFTSGGMHWVQLQQRNCIHRDSFNILNPTPSVNLGEDQHFCDDLDLILDAGPNAAEYLWNTDATTQSIHVTRPGKYTVKITDQYGCIAKDSVLLSLSLSPSVDIGADTTICVRSLAHIGPDEDPAIKAYLWSTGETSRRIDVEFDNIYTLRVTDNEGCVGYDSVKVTVDPNVLPNEIYIPNAFTPNGDYLNDYFPYSEYTPQPGFVVVIYSRWGEKVFDSRNSETQHWDGTYQGKKVHNEAFIYYVEYFSCNGIRKYIKGTVNPLN